MHLHDGAGRNLQIEIDADGTVRERYADDARNDTAEGLFSGRVIGDGRFRRRLGRRRGRDQQQCDA